MRRDISITRFGGAFVATNKVTGSTGYGNTWMEALGALVATNTADYNIFCIKYDTDDNATKEYIIERGLNKDIV